MEISLKQRRAVVCGASRGIGRAVALVLAECGAELVVLARSEDALGTLVEGLPGGARRHRSRAVDFNDTSATADVFAGIAGEGPVHVLVNNTGGPPAGRAFDAAPDDYLAAFRQHLVAAQLAARALVPGMQAEGYGRIVNIISTSVKEPIPGLGVSNTIRGAMASWAKTLSRELAADGITVNNVLPGFTATERLDYLFRQRAAKSGGSPEQMAEAARAQVPAGRFARPEETAWAVAFLVSDRAAYINGVSLPVDGGRTGCL
ncbi:MAG: SDR family oxidoreductase [Gammaproteobacteria bacterium]